jgi:hypothetical protein
MLKPHGLSRAEATCSPPLPNFVTPQSHVVVPGFVLAGCVVHRPRAEAQRLHHGSGIMHTQPSPDKLLIMILLGCVLAGCVIHRSLAEAAWPHQGRGSAAACEPGDGASLLHCLHHDGAEPRHLGCCGMPDSLKVQLRVFTFCVCIELCLSHPVLGVVWLPSRDNLGLCRLVSCC